jgi:hypothetical protein
MAWLARANRQTGFLPWEKLTLAAVFATPILARGVGTALHLPVGTAAGYALLCLCAMRARHEYRLACPAAECPMLSQAMRVLATG